MSEYKINKSLQYPNVEFQDYYNKFETVEDMLAGLEWNDFFSHFCEISREEQEILIGESLQELNMFNEAKQSEELSKCANSFKYWCHRYVEIYHYKHGQIPFINYKYQDRVIEGFENNKFNIVSKFRQAGLTTLSLLKSIHNCLFKNDQKINIVSRTDRESIDASYITQQVMDNLPKWMYDPKQNNTSKYEKKFHTTNSRIYFNTPLSTIGQSSTCLIFNEAAFIEDMEKHWEAMYPIIANGSSVQVFSSVNGINSWYNKIYKEAIKGNNQFNPIAVDYWEHPTFSNPEWVETVKSNYSKKIWKQEFMRNSCAY